MITKRDRDVVDWIGRLGVVGPEHLMFRFGMGRTVAYRRLAELRAAGLIERFNVLHGRPGQIAATLAGLRLCGLEHLGVARVSAATATHWEASSLVAVLLEERNGLASVGSVREIRAAERAARAPVASTTVGASTHLPDLVVWGPAGAGQPGGVIVEVELTVKAPMRLRAILRAWARARALGVVAGVIYVCTPDVMRALDRAMTETATKHLIVPVGMPDADVLRGDPHRWGNVA